MDVISTIERLTVIPVITINDADKAVKLADSLIEGGLPCAEITFRTDAAEESIKRINKHMPDMVLAAGTVLTLDQLKRAVDAGASAIVSPCFNQEIIRYCIDNHIAVFPGIATPTELDMAYQMGLRHVKVFPAGALGGLKYIKAIAAPYSMMRFMPTGGVSALNLAEYLEYEKIFAIGGSWIAKKELIAEDNWKEITENAAEAVRIAKEARS